ncbi:MAG: PEP-CTERM sorting domain-containing protein [Phycisphaerales bacterium]
MWKMNRKMCWMMGWGATLWMATLAQAAIANFADDFTGAANSAPDSSKWTSAVTGGVTSVQNGSSDWAVNITPTSTSARGVIRSVRSDFNYFQQPLTVQWKLDSLGGSTGGGVTNPTLSTYKANRAYLMIVDDDNGAQATTLAFPGSSKTSIGLAVDRITDDNNNLVAYVFRLEQTVSTGAGNNVIFLSSKTLSGTTLPSLITITFDHVANGVNPDKAAITVNLTGATFTDSTSTLSDVSRQLHATFNPGILTEAAYNNFYLAAGVTNSLNTSTALLLTGTSATTDYINVVVPEPATLGLMALGGMMMLLGRGR